MSPSQWLEPPRRLLILFLAVMLTIAGTLGWLGWHLFEQDRELSRQGTQKRLDGAAEAAAAVLARKLSEMETSLTAEPRLDPTEDFLTVIFNGDSIEAFPRENLPYYPDVPAALMESPKVFDPVEAVEWREENYVKAAAMYRELVRSPDPAIRAGAMLRLARSLLKAGALDEALATYSEMSRLGPIPVAKGMPADLEARYKRIDLLSKSGQRSICEQEAASLYSDLVRGRWHLSLDQWQHYSETVHSCFRPDAKKEELEKEAAVRAAGAKWLWHEWQRFRRGNGNAAGRNALWIESSPLLLVWRASPDRFAGAIGGRGFIETDWRPALHQIGEEYAFRLSDAEGHAVLGGAATEASQQASRSLSDAQLPSWTLHAEIAEPGPELARLDTRRRWFLAGLGLAGALILIGGYFVARAFARELEVARLQADFVSTVSHEFRTPLASLRQASELLADGRVSSEERRQAYYDALRSETERLQRLVEDLLDFRRMDAGVQQYQMEPLSIEDLVKEVIEEFSRKIPDNVYRIEYSLSSDEEGVRGSVDQAVPLVEGDRHALGRVLWNLLDNAVKYSPNSKTIRVVTRLEGGHRLIIVTDQGMGIARSDLRKIFKKFVRAEGTKTAGIKGTGLGLAMAHQIVTAHGGRITVTSEPGVGSTFTILLPAIHETAGSPARKQMAT